MCWIRPAPRNRCTNLWHKDMSRSSTARSKDMHREVCLLLCKEGNFDCFLLEIGLIKSVILVNINTKS